ncbi:MAG: flagellar basal-body rod protein FlgG [Candidatus Coatesbacteria bacterium]|nr:flagellar basal-body rod protein FlgG [Candidatus Coatesbacteria bacterium]
MIRTLWTSATGMQAQQLTIDTIANNLANVNTGGFKKSRAEFQDLMYETLRSPGAPIGGSIVPSGIQIGHGVRPVSTQREFSTGSLKNTNSPLDIAIEGNGFFQVVLPSGDMAYTRAGSFHLDSSGSMVTSDGYRISPDIVIPNDATSISIESDGTVSVLQPGQTSSTEVGTIELALFSNPGGLRALGRNLFQETDSSGVPTTGTPGQEGRGEVAQGFLELSNVSVVDEMVQMIMTQRAYELNAKSIQSADQMMSQANNLKR